MFEKGNKLSLGRPPNSESIRAHLRKFEAMDIEALEKYRPKTTGEALARRRILLAQTSDDYRSIDALSDQLDGKPNQPQTIDATLETKVNPIVELLKQSDAVKPKAE